jgi:hypothetical protein
MREVDPFAVLRTEAVRLERPMHVRPEAGSDEEQRTE